MNGLFIINPEARRLVYGDDVGERLSDLANFPARLQTRNSIRKNLELLRDIDAVFSGWGGPIMDEEFLDAAPNLKAVFHGAGSIRQIVTETFWDREILITSATAANAIPVAEYTLSQVLFCLKMGWQHNASCKSGVRASGADIPAIRPRGAGAFGTTAGLISMGTIARMVRKYLRAHDVRIVAYDPFLTQSQAEELDIELVSLDELFSRADVVSLHTPDLPETQGMIHAGHFRAMRLNASFINTARSTVIRHDHLIDVLQERPDLWAVLDVTESASDAEYTTLQKLPNVTLTPHMAGSVGLECRRMGHLMADELERFLAGEPLRYAITRERAEIMA